MVSNHSIIPSILPKTLLKTPSGLIPIEELHIGDYVTSFDLETNSHIDVKVTNISKQITDIVTVIETDKGVIYAPQDQLFYDPKSNEWVKAEDLTTDSLLVDFDSRTIRCRDIQRLRYPTCIYKISLEDPHLFFSSDHHILTHNFAHIASTAIIEGGRIVVTCLRNPEVAKKIFTTIGATFFGLFTRKMLVNSQNNHRAVRAMNKARQQALQYATKQGLKAGGRAAATNTFQQYKPPKPGRKSR